MHILKNGDIKLKFNELRIGMILKDANRCLVKSQCKYQMITHIWRGKYPSFVTLGTDNPNHFIIPISVSHKALIEGNYCKRALQSFTLVDQNKLIGFKTRSEYFGGNHGNSTDQN